MFFATIIFVLALIAAAFYIGTKYPSDQLRSDIKTHALKDSVYYLSGKEWKCINVYVDEKGASLGGEIRMIMLESKRGIVITMACWDINIGVETKVRLRYREENERPVTWFSPIDKYLIPCVVEESAVPTS